MSVRPCRLCGASIEMVKTPAGKQMPVDVSSRVTVVTNDGRVVTGRTPHWSTCPNADEFRKKRSEG